MTKVDLPKYCYARGNRIWVRFKNEEGDWVNKKSPYTLDQVEYARRYVNALVKGIAGKVERGDAPVNTVREYGRKWLKEREQRGIPAVVDERSRLEKYAFPYLGDVTLAELRPKHVRDMVRRLRELKGDAKIAPRTIHHVFNALHNVLECAIVDEHVYGENPVKVKAGELPKKVDADPEWRSQATFTVTEVERLVSDPLIPVVRRVQYALKALAGMRHGEAAALCWRHIDQVAEPLWRLNIVQAWCSRSSTIKSTKTEETRAIPVHPALASVLTAWRDLHWARIYGRQPTLDDFVIPTQTGSCLAVADAGEAFKRDLAALGMRVEAGKLRDRGGHDLRAWYETRCIEDGADSVLLRRTTHAPPKNVSGGYERFSWASLCREVEKLKVVILEGDALKFVTSSLHMEIRSRKRWAFAVTPSGLEPGSTSTGGGIRSPATVDAYRRRSADAHARGRSAVTSYVTTAARLIEKALRAGDTPRALELVAQLRDLTPQ